jgi:hypothetical protein
MIVNLYGTSKRVIHNIIHNNLANGLLSSGIVINNLDEVILRFDSVIKFNQWWENKYGDSEIGLDYSNVIINFH